MSVNMDFGDLMQVNGKIWNGVPVDPGPESLLGLGWRSFYSDGRPVLKSREKSLARPVMGDPQGLPEGNR